MSGELYGQANRYGKDIKDMSDFAAGFDDDLNMGENESTPTAGPLLECQVNPWLSCVCNRGTKCCGVDHPTDDSDQPITAEWWMDVFGPNPIATNCGWLAYYQRGALLNSGRLNVKTRGDARELCRLLGVPLK